MATATNRTDKILVVDDDARIRDLLRRYLRQEGFEIMIAEDGKALNRILLRETVDLIVLDLMMPGEDGLSICRRLRSANDRTPIIMLTAKGEDVDRIVGLEVGADDYLGKPFSPRELQARIKALLRRAEFRQPEKEKEPSRRLRFAEWTLDTLSHQQTHEDGSLLDLAGSDAMLLGMFLQQPGVVLDRDTISDATRGRESLPMERGIDVQISRLRQKLGDNGKSPRIIKTIRGSGYMLIAEVHELP